MTPGRLQHLSPVSKMILLDIMERNEEDSANDQVALMTMHASKGLEFPYVYIVGMEEELLPHRTSIEEENIEEDLISNNREEDQYTKDKAILILYFIT